MGTSPLVAWPTAPVEQIFYRAGTRRVHVALGRTGAACVGHTDLLSRLFAWLCELHKAVVLDMAMLDQRPDPSQERRVVCRVVSSRKCLKNHYRVGRRVHLRKQSVRLFAACSPAP